MQTVSRYQPSILLMSVVLGVVGAIGSAAQVQAASFTVLPFGSYPDSRDSSGFLLQSLQISGDGTTVVSGRPIDFNSGVAEAFRWTQSKGLQLLGGNRDAAIGISYDGSTVVGSNSQAFRWSETSGIQNLGYLPGFSNTSIASAVSDDGRTVVGNSSNTFSSRRSGQAFRWTPANGMQGLGYLKNSTALPGFTDFTTSEAQDVSGDGSVVIGTSNFYGSYDEAFRWTSSGGMQGLGFLPGGSFSVAKAVSQDGQTVVGTASTNTGSLRSKAFRWTAANGMQDLDNLGYFYDATSSLDVSSNGSTIVGGGFGINGGEAFIWTETEGLKTLQSVLTAAGLNLTGRKLNVATSVSADGRSIVGYGRNLNGQVEAWLARLDATPTPTAVPETTPITPLLAGLAALGISLGRKRNQLI
jgi:probable HAF family extracellular repeat protein